MKQRTFIQHLSDTIMESLQQILSGVLEFFPKILAATLVLIIGWVVAKILGKLIGRIIHIIQLDTLLDSAGVKKVFAKAGTPLKIDILFQEIVKWFTLIVFFISAAKILELSQITEFLNDVLNYIPRVIVAVVILIVGVLVAKFISELVKGTITAAKLESSKTLSSVTRYVIIIFSFLAAFEQLGIAKVYLNSLFQAFVYMLAGAAALSFGLGGKEVAADFLKKIKKDFSSK